MKRVLTLSLLIFTALLLFNSQVLAVAEIESSIGDVTGEAALESRQTHFDNAIAPHVVPTPSPQATPREIPDDIPDTSIMSKILGQSRNPFDTASGGAGGSRAPVTYVDQPGDYTITTDNGAGGLDNGDIVTWNGDTPATGLTYGTDAFGTVQDGIDNADPGGTVYVAAGTYNEAVVISQSVYVYADDGAILDGGGTGSGIAIQTGNVTVDNFTIQNFGANGIVVGYPLDLTSGVWQNVHLTNNIVQNITGAGGHGFGIYVGYQAEAFPGGFVDSGTMDELGFTSHLDFSGLIISGNDVSGTANATLVIQSITGTPPLDISNNHFHNAGASGIWVDTARELDIDGNTIEDNNYGLYFSSIADAGWYEENSAYSPQNITITNNVIQNNSSFGMAVYNAWPGTFTLYHNQILGHSSGNGVANYLPTTLPAENNWWGSILHDDVADNVTGNVDFDPWAFWNGTAFIDGLAAPTDAYVHAQIGDFTLDVDNDGSTDITIGDEVTWNGATPVSGLIFGHSAFVSIQDGVDAVVASTVHLADGLYTQSNTTIDQPTTIIGDTRAGVIIAPEDEDDNDDSTWGGANLHHGFIVPSDDVTIQNLTIDGQANPALTAGKNNFRLGIVTGNGVGVANLQVIDVNVQHVFRRGIQVSSVTTGHLFQNCLVDDVELYDGILSLGGGDFINNTITNTPGASGLRSNGFKLLGTFTGNVIDNAFFGIVADSDAEIIDNQISNTAWAIVMNNIYYASGPSDALIQGNTISDMTKQFSGSTLGISIVNVSDGGLIGGPNPGDANIIDNTYGDGVPAIVAQWNPDGNQVTIQGNQITVSGTNSAIALYHNQDETNPILVKDNVMTASGSDGTTLGNGTGIFMSDNNGGELGISYATITGNTIDGFARGIDLHQSATSPVGGRNVHATIGGTNAGDSNDIINCETGIRIFETDNTGNRAVARITGNNTSITNNTVGIDVDGGVAVIENNNLASNTNIGVRIQNDAIVDMGQNVNTGPTDYTTHGTSVGNNTLGGYTGGAYPGGSFAIVNLNSEPGAGEQNYPPDVRARNNLFDVPDPEVIVHHDTDNDALAYVDFQDEVAPVNDPPLHHLAGDPDDTNWATQTVPEDGVLTFNAANGNALTISDPDAGAQQVQTTLEATDGILHVSNLNGVNYYYGQNSPTLTVRAPVAVLNNVLDGLTYTPTADFNGASTITWTTDDRGHNGTGGALIDSDVINITVAPVNDPPDFSLPTAPTTSLEDAGAQTVSGFATAMDDGDPGVTQVLTFTVNVASTTGNLAFATAPALDATSGDLTYEAAANTNGTATVDVYLMDNGGTDDGGDDTSPTQTFTIMVTPVNDAPTQTTNAGLTVDEGNSGTIDDTVLLADDPDHSHAQLTYTVTTPPVNGTLSSTYFTQADLDNDLLSYQHDGGETTGDSFDFQVCDALNECISGMFNITITPVNDPPVAVDDSYSTTEDTQLTIADPGVLANDTDVDGGALSAVLDSGPTNAASFSLNPNGSFSYTPTSNWSGTDSFTYHAYDTADDSNVATVTITVAGENDGPEITVPGAQTVAEDTDLDITGISVSDTDADPADIQLSAGVANGTLTLLSPAGLTIVDPDGDASFVVQGTVAELNAALAAGLRYYGDPDYNGPDQIDLEVDDLGQSTRNRATITASIAITVNPVNDPPTLTVPGPFVVEAGQMVNVPGIVVSDIDDGGSSNLQVDLAVTSGLLSTDGNTWAASLSLTDTELNLNNELSNLQYQTVDCNPATDQITVDVDDQGNTGSGGNGTASGSIDGTIIDNTPPTLVCQAVTVDLADGNPAIVTVDDIFDATNSTDNCGIDLNSLEIFRLTPGACSDNSGGTLLEFGCVDVGLTVDVELIGMDNAGNPDTCQTTVTVTTSDPSLCEPCTGSGTTVTLNLPGRRAVAISPPVNLANPTVGDVFSMLPNKLVYTRSCNGTYRYLTDADVLESGVGYFVRTGLYTTVDVDFIGCELTSPVQIERCGTWNGFMTGNPFPYALDVSNFVVSPPAPVYMQVFVNGYWRTGINPVPAGAAVQIYTSATCLTINPDPPAPLLMYASDATPDQPGEDLGSDTIAQTSSRDWTYRLEQSTPNPFTHTATIRYQLPVGQRVKLDVFNVAGQLITTLVDSDVAAGDHEITWDGTNANGESVNSGVYFYRLTTNDFSETKRMVLMR